jgi:hypothetical protein
LETANKEVKMFRHGYLRLGGLALFFGLCLSPGMARADAAEDLEKARAQIRALQERLDRQQKQIEQLTQQVAELTKELAKARAGVPGKRPNPVNPPPDSVKGTITKIDKKDASLVQISVGSDAGLARGHTLEVYRLKPKAEYLGRIQVIEVEAKSAVGRLMRSDAKEKRSALQVGDEVASKVQTGDPGK